MPSTFTQPEINLRELADEMCGVNNKVAQNAKALLPLQAYAGRNLLINGDMSVWQRGTSHSVGGLGSADRWESWFGAGAGSLSQIESSKDALPYGRYMARYSLSGSASAVAAVLAQKFENPTNLSGKTITLSIIGVGVSSDLEVELNLFYTTTVSLLIAPLKFKSGEKTSVTMVVPDLSGYNFTDDSYLSIKIGQSVAEDIEIDFWSVQLELGSEATEFETVDPATQLTKCQRYYQRFMTNTYILKYGIITSSNAEVFQMQLPTTMRITPTPTIVTQPSITNSSTLTLQANEYQITLKSDVLANGYYGVSNSGVYEADAEL